jgi:hypothetical protein
VYRRRLLGAVAALTVGSAGCTARSGGGAEGETPVGGPRIVDRSFAAADGACADGTDEATVQFADEAVRVDGQLGTPTPCYGASLDGASLDGDTLVVAVARTAQTPDVCVQCLGTVPYDATVRFAGGLPDAVRVEHDGESVATTSR